jgi:hypothetical protein
MAAASGNERAHALYAPSAAHRWMRCAASVGATAHIQSKSSVYAAEGTVAHHVLEQCLLSGDDAKKWIGEVIDVEIEGTPSSLIFDKAGAEAVQVALDWIRNVINEADEWSAEQRVSLRLIGATGCYGTSDFMAVVSMAGRIFVVDYKHGAGVPVEVKDNEQLRIYALGAILGLEPARLAGIRQVQTTIIQPRYFGHPDGPIRSWTYTVPELMDFGADVLAAIDACEGPNPTFVPGEWCKWCGIETTCTARVNAVSNEIAVFREMEDGMVLSTAEQEQLLHNLESMDVEGFIKSLRAALHKSAEEGVPMQFYKLVDKRASRVWNKPEDEVESALELLVASRHKNDLDFRNSSLKSPAQIEELIGKGKEARALIAHYTTAVSSGTNLVPLSNPKRAAVTSAEDEFDALTD